MSDCAHFNQQLQSSALREIQCVADNTWVQEFCLPPDFIGFQGHFPDEPLLPAVTQIQLGYLVAAVADANPHATIAAVSRAKFVQPVFPMDTIRVCCQKMVKDNQPVFYKLTLMVKEQLVSTFHLILKG